MTRKLLSIQVPAKRPRSETPAAAAVVGQRYSLRQATRVNYQVRIKLCLKLRMMLLLMMPLVEMCLLMMFFLSQEEEDGEEKRRKKDDWLLCVICDDWHRGGCAQHPLLFVKVRKSLKP